jgi:hypothetical protein
MLAFQSKDFQNGDLQKSMTQGGKEMMAGRWRSMLGRRDALGHQS